MLTELQAALRQIPEDWNGSSEWREPVLVLREAARRIANLDLNDTLPAWKGKWDDTDPDDWETWTLWAHGSEAGDWRPATGRDVLAALGITTEDDEPEHPVNEAINRATEDDG